MMEQVMNSVYIILTLVVINLDIRLILGLSSTKFAVLDKLNNHQDVYTIINPLSRKYNAVDLALGSPNFEPPVYIREAVIQAVSSNYTFSQYTNPAGAPRLINAVARLYSKLLKRTLEPKNNVIVGVGATQLLFATLQSHTNVGDEWIIIEPAFDTYVPTVKAAFGKPVYVHLRPNKKHGGKTSKDWTFDRDELSKAFNKKTKGILFNNPSNPLGKVYTYKELEFIANLAKKWDALVISDEVYEYMIYDNNEHIRMATLPDMFDRTITLCSSSKTFSATGYRIGWAYGGTQIINNLKAIERSMVGCSPTFTQEAIAQILELELEHLGEPSSYLSKFRVKSQERRDYVVKAVQDLGLSVVVPEGGYFFVANFTNFGNKYNYNIESGEEQDTRFDQWMIKNVGINAVPMSAFYGSQDRPEDHVRFCFIKADDTLQQVNEVVRKFKLRNCHDKVRN